MLLDEKPRRLRRSARVCSEKKKEYSGFVRSAKKYHRNNSFGALTTSRARPACTHEGDGWTGREKIQTYSAQREEAKEMQKRRCPGSALRGCHLCRAPCPKSIKQDTKKKTVPGSAGSETLTGSINHRSVLHLCATLVFIHSQMQVKVA